MRRVDIRKVEYATRLLQKNIRLILAECPDLLELDAILKWPDLDEGIVVDLQQPLIQLAAKLKSKYRLGELPIFDQIIDAEVEVTPSEKEKLQGCDPVVLPTEKKEKQDDAAHDFSLPALPPIMSPELHSRVFVHKSTINSKSYLNQDELINMHNERLEFLGDSILNNLVTLIIYDRYPGVSEGELTRIRSHLIDNRTLAEFALAYGLNHKLKANINEEVLKCGDQKIYADVFEAYVGALGIEKGLDLRDVREWLVRLYAKKLRDFDTALDCQPLNKDAKTELYSVVGTAQFHPMYHIISKGDGVDRAFTIECRMGDDILGVGTASNQKDAGLRAAMSALTNRPLLDKYHQLRAASDKKESVKSNKRFSIEEDLGQGKKRKPTNDFMSRSELLPVCASEDDPLDNDAKNKLYAEMGKKIGEVPQYVVSSGGGDV